MKSSKTTVSKKVKPAKPKPTDLLSLCPTQGAGWCSFPFSPSQLKRRMKTKINKEVKEEK